MYSRTPPRGAARVRGSRSYPLPTAQQSSVGLAACKGALRQRPNVEGASRQSFRIIHARLCQRGRLSMYTFRSPRTSSTVCSSSRVGMRGCGHASALHRQPSRSMPRVLIHRFPRQVWKCSFTLLAQSVGSTNGLLADKERESVARLRVGAIALWKSAPPSGTTTR